MIEQARTMALAIKDAKGLTYRDLGKRMGCSSAHVHALFVGGNNNWTMETTVKVFQALDCAVELKIKPLK